MLHCLMTPAAFMNSWDYSIHNNKLPSKDNKKLTNIKTHMRTAGVEAAKGKEQDKCLNNK